MIPQRGLFRILSTTVAQRFCLVRSCRVMRLRQLLRPKKISLIVWWRHSCLALPVLDGHKFVGVFPAGAPGVFFHGAAVPLEKTNIGADVGFAATGELQNGTSAVQRVSHKPECAIRSVAIM
jgi:hypothetical protein